MPLIDDKCLSARLAIATASPHGGVGLGHSKAFSCPLTCHEPSHHSMCRVPYIGSSTA